MKDLEKRVTELENAIERLKADQMSKLHDAISLANSIVDLFGKTSLICDDGTKNISRQLSFGKDLFVRINEAVRRSRCSSGRTFVLIPKSNSEYLFAYMKHAGFGEEEAARLWFRGLYNATIANSDICGTFKIVKELDV